MAVALPHLAPVTPPSGVWEPDTSQRLAHSGPSVKELKDGDATSRVTARDNKPTLRVAYFFSGVPRKASIAGHLERLCAASGFGLHLEDIYIYAGGPEHDLMLKSTQDVYLARIAAG